MAYADNLLYKWLYGCDPNAIPKVTKVKVSRFIGFHSSVGKTFADLASSVLKVLKKAIAQKIH